MAIRSGGPEPGTFHGTTDATRERVWQAIVEATESVASPEVARRIVVEALAAAGLAQAPARARELERLARGHLRRAVQVVLGLDAAELVESAVLGIAAHLDDARDETTGVRWTDAPPRPSAERAPKTPPVASVRTAGVVLVASTDALRVSVIERAAKAGATVAQAPDLMSLIDAAQAELHSPPLVIVDCLAPSVQIPTLAIVAPDLPRGTRIVLWGISDDAWIELRALAGERDARVFSRADVGDTGVYEAVRRFLR